MVGEINCVIPCAHGGTLLIKYGWLVNIFGLTTRTQKLGSGPDTRIVSIHTSTLFELLMFSTFL